MIKSNTSGWIHDTLPGLRDFQWQNSYAAFTVSKSVLPDVVTYIDRQQEHHRQRSFSEELRALLSRHGVEFEEQYLM